MKKNILSIILSLAVGFSCFGLEVTLPEPSANEVYVASSATADSGFWLDVIINFITKYLWVAMIVVSMVALARGGFLLIIGRGEEAEFKKANKVLIYAVIGIVISLLSYVITHAIVNLF